MPIEPTVAELTESLYPSRAPDLAAKVRKEFSRCTPLANLLFSGKSIGIPGIEGVTPNGGEAGGAGDLEAMLRGIVAYAARAHRTVGSLVAPSSTRIPLENAATSLIASRYTLEFVEGDADDAGWLQYMYAALSFSNNLPADEFYVKYLLGDSSLVQVYPTREDAQEGTNIIATAVVDGDAISSASALLLTDSSARWGWIYGTGANPDVDGTIWKATRVSAPPHLIDLPSGGDPTGRRYVLSVDIVVTNESGSAKNLSIGLTGGNTQFSTLVPFPIPNETVSGRFVAEIEFALANYQTATSVRQAITVRRATLGGVDIAPGGFSTYVNWTKSHYHGRALGAIATLVSGASASLRSAKITLEPEEALA